MEEAGDCSGDTADIHVEDVEEELVLVFLSHTCSSVPQLKMAVDTGNKMIVVNSRIVQRREVGAGDQKVPAVVLARTPLSHPPPIPPLRGYPTFFPPSIPQLNQFCIDPSIPNEDKFHHRSSSASL